MVTSSIVNIEVSFIAVTSINVLHKSPDADGGMAA